MIVYLAAPVSAPTIKGVRENIARAKRWLSYAKKRWPQWTIIAPWIVDLEMTLDEGLTEADTRARGLVDCENVARVCGKIILAGGVLKPGMEREVAACLLGGNGAFREVLDLLHLGAEPPELT